MSVYRGKADSTQNRRPFRFCVDFRPPEFSPRTPTAGGRKAPRHEIAGWERRWCRNYGGFAAGSGVAVVERGGNVRNFATRHVGELNFEPVTDPLFGAVLCFFVFPNGHNDVTAPRVTLSAGSQ